MSDIRHSLQNLADALSPNTGTSDGFVDNVETSLARISQALPEILGGKIEAESLAAEYDDQATYDIGDYCTHNGVLYICATAVTTAESWDSAKWVAIPLIEKLKEKLDAPADGAVAGRYLMVGQNGEPVWDQLDESDIRQSVYDWLSAHPEAIVVNDGTITRAKLDNSVGQAVDNVAELKNDFSILNIQHHDPYELVRGVGYIYADGHDINVIADSTTRVCSNVIYVPEGKTWTIDASGFGKYAVTTSLDGGTITTGTGWLTAEKISRTIIGPKYTRFAFAYADDSPIVPGDVVFSIKYDDNAELYRDICVNDFNVVTSFERPFDGAGNIVATYGHMYVRNNSGILQFSKNKGVAWSGNLDISSLGLIKTYHLFANGCIAFFTHDKAYYSEDFETFSEASVYESDGVTPYTPSVYDNFTTTKDDQNRKFIDGVDIYLFGNYGITDEANTRRIIWCSVDNGHSYKVVYEFNVAGSRSIRHVHTVVYNPNVDKYLCCTGDSNSENLVLQLAYAGNNTWDIDVLGSYAQYKWASVCFYGAYVYYCLDGTPGKVRRCRYKDIQDLTKHETILDNLPNDVIGLFMGQRGDMLVTLSIYRSGVSRSVFQPAVDARRMYYSEDREKFYNFIGENPTDYIHAIYYGFMGVNSDGCVMSGVWTVSEPLAAWDKLPSVSLDSMVKKHGFPNAFKPYDLTWEIIPVVDVECQDVTVSVGNQITIEPKLYPWNASSLDFEVVEYDSTIVSINGSVITGVASGQTTAKIRSKTNWEAYAMITITVT